MAEDRARNRVAEVDPRRVERVYVSGRGALRRPRSSVADLDVRRRGEQARSTVTRLPRAFVRVGIAAAADLGLGDAAEDRHGLAAPSARTAVDGLDAGEVLGQDGVAGIALGQRAEHLGDAYLAVGDDLPRCRVADDDVGGVRSVEEPSLALDEHRADLLGHAVEVVHPAQTGDALELSLVLAVVDRPLGQLLPAAGVDQDRRSADPPRRG